MNLDKDSFRMVAIKAYDNPYCLSEEEFEEDLKRIGTIRKMLSNYIIHSKLNLRLLVNHFISYYNVFDHVIATRMLFYKLDEDQKPYANSILKFLALPMLEKDNYIETFYEEICELYRNR